MSEIPDDILAAAKDAVFDFDCDWTADGRRYGEQQERDAVAIVARALLAERLSATERAAKIVFQHFAPNQGYSMDPMAIDAIRAIRSQP